MKAGKPNKYGTFGLWPKSNKRGALTGAWTAKWSIGSKK
jgi:hypothetical protein